MAAKPLPPAEFLRECFSYDPETGELRWRHRPLNHFSNEHRANNWNAKYAGRSGVRHGRYLVFNTNYEGGEARFYAHRVIFKIMTGRDPSEQIDHVNGVGSDNKWVNLREATPVQNMRNQFRSRHLPRGVIAIGNKFVAQATVGGKNKYLGRHDTSAAAHAAYLAFVRPLYGEFLNAAPTVETIFD
jgi:hypothetical protein